MAGQLRASLVVLVSLLLGACSTLRDGTAEPWPPSLPPVAFFEATYARDTELHSEQTLQEYLYWVRKFYEGTTLYPRGWNDITADLVAAADEGTSTRERERTLYRLGRDIAAEWSKANSVRLVDAGHLSVWGVAVGRAVKEDNVDDTLDFIASDLQKLLAGEVPSDAITADRYHEPDPDDWFAL